jgi:hypothetical protein
MLWKLWIFCRTLEWFQLSINDLSWEMMAPSTYKSCTNHPQNSVLGKVVVNPPKLRDEVSHVTAVSFLFGHANIERFHFLKQRVAMDA